MRIAGGTLRGRILKAPPADSLRPTQDAVREAVFSMLATVVPDSSFLDLYAGTGAVGIEAYSRGARAVTWVEQSHVSLGILQKNVQTLCPSPLPPEMKVVRSDVRAWLKRPTLPAGSVTIVYADPPYVVEQGADDGMSELLKDLLASGILAPRSFVVIEQRDRTPVPVAEGFDLLCTRRYGKTIVSLYRRETQQPVEDAPQEAVLEPGEKPQGAASPIPAFAQGEG